MNKKDKYFFAVSLGLVVSSQNVMAVSGAESLSANSDLSINSDDDIQIKVTTNSPETDLDESNTSKEYQPDPEENKTYSMGGSSLMTARINEVSTSPKIVTLSNSKAIGSGVVNSTTLNVRSGPSTSDSSIGVLKNGESIEILSKSNNWYKVDYKGKEGYVSASYLTLSPIEKGIDVSKWNGTINWNSVKNSGVDYVIIRAGYGTSTVDPQFKSYIEGAKSAGLKIGVYWFSYATSAESAAQEAQKCLDTIAPYKNSISYPVFFDYEYDSVRYANNNGVKVTKDLATKMSNAFINKVKAQGYTTGLYTNKDFSSTYFSDDLISSNNLWVAQYASTNTFGKPYAMWQYSERGSVPGISGYVDMNYTYLKTSTNSTSTDTPSTSTQKGVTTANINFRNGASTSSSIISTIPKNTEVEIVEKYSSSWYKVKYKNVTGYVSSKYVSLNGSSSDNSTTTPPSTSSENGVTSANVNFRNSASTSSSIIATIPKNTTIKIVDKSTSGWYKVEYKGVTGYVSSSYVTLESSNNNSSTTNAVTTGSVNFRKGATTSSSVITKLPKNTSINVVDKSNSNWYKVEYNGNTGYVSSKYVSLNSSSQTTTKGTTTANLNLRKSTSTSSSILDTIPKNTTIEITEKLSSGWYKVKYKNLTGYVSGTYVKI